MRRWSLRGILTLWALGLVALAVLAVAAVSYRQVTRLAREEALARAVHAAERSVAALERGLDPAVFGHETDIAIRVLPAAEIENSFGDPRVSLWKEALEKGSAARVLSGELGAVATQAFSIGETRGVVEAQIPDESIRQAPRRFVANSFATALVLALAALGIAILLARRLGTPLESLQRAARRIERGELHEPIESAGEVELGELAGAFEAMRRSLLDMRGEIEGRRAELEAVVAGVAEGVLAVDRERRIRFISEPAAGLLGVTREAALGRFCGNVLRPAPVGNARPCDEACPILHARFRGTARATETLRAGGCERRVVVSASGRSDGMQVVILSEESAAEAAQRARDEAVADLAHELQTPLAAQSASLELLRDRLSSSDQPALELVLALEAGTSRLRRLIDNLLESVRIESGQLSIRRARVDLDLLFEEAVAMTKPLLERRRQRFEIALPHPLPAPIGDAQRLGQVLVNLLSNASKFGPEGSRVTLGASVIEGSVELWVEDEGPGFPDTARAADPGRFRRGPSEPAAEGSGLGLWISRSILDRHKGVLRVERLELRTRVVASLPTEELG